MSAATPAAEPPGRRNRLERHLGTHGFLHRPKAEFSFCQSSKQIFQFFAFSRFFLNEILLV